MTDLKTEKTEEKKDSSQKSNPTTSPSKHYAYFKQKIHPLKDVKHNPRTPVLGGPSKGLRRSRSDS